MQSDVRESVLEAVESVLWLDRVTAEDAKYRQSLQQQQQHRDNFGERCLVCTLALGTCEHTADWAFHRETERSLLEEFGEGYLDEDFKSQLDVEIDSALDVLGGGGGDGLDAMHTDMDLGQLDLENMRWSTLNELQTDKIGAASMALFPPDDRFWHSSVCLNEKFLIVFGGFRYKGKGQFRPFQSIVDPTEVEFLNDLRVYDVQNRSWFGVRGQGLVPPVNTNFVRPVIQDAVVKYAVPRARYGHCAAALDSTRMLMFGGRGERGIMLNDTWIYSIESDIWTEIVHPPHFQVPLPAPRYFCTACSDLRHTRVFLFGGTNGKDNFGDLWAFYGKEESEDGKESLLWERTIVVGLPPSPRYGHQMVCYGEDMMMLVGGCAVSPESEVIGSNFTPDETLALMSVSSELQRSYQIESQSAELGTKALELSNDNGDTSLADVIKKAADVTALLHLREKETRLAEQQMVDAFKVAKSAVYFNAKKARHPLPFIDVYFLNLARETWEQKQFPKLTAANNEFPRSRIHFGASCIGDFLFVNGGAMPTSLDNRQVDTVPGQLFVLDIKMNKWLKPLPVNSKEYLKESVKMAEVDMIRSREKCDAERMRSLSLGAPAGITKESALAESMYNVCKWRYEMLVKESGEAAASPAPCYGATMTMIRQRLVYIGGWAASENIRKGILVLEMENEAEKQRRMQEELHARLERERQAADVKATMENIVSAHELRSKILDERRKEEREQQLMAVQDFMSTLPPLFLPPPVKFAKANRHTIWVKWNRVLKDTKKQLLDKNDVTYYLYMKTSFENFLVGDRVLVTEKEAMGGKAAAKSRKFNKMDVDLPAQLSSEEQAGLYFATKWRRFAGEIIKIRTFGQFDILFNDGTSETNVPRCRIMHDSSYANAYNATMSFGDSTRSIETATVSSNNVESVKAMLKTNVFATSVRKRLKTKLSSMEKQRESVKKFHAAQSKHPMPLHQTKRFDEFGEEIEFTGPEEPAFLGDPKVTVQPDPSWQLVYVGKDCSYACSGLVPRPVLEQEPQCRIAVMFCLQTHGTDYPQYERSQMSRPVIFSTASAPSQELMALEAAQNAPRAAVSMPAVPPPSASEESSSDAADPLLAGAMSRTKKEIITAVIRGQQMVSIEKRNHFFYSEGYGEDYL